MGYHRHITLALRKKDMEPTGRTGEDRLSLGSIRGVWCVVSFWGGFLFCFPRFFLVFFFNLPLSTLGNYLYIIDTYIHLYIPICSKIY